MRVGILGSGSRGNAIAIESRGTLILLDCGFGPRDLRRRAKACGLDLAEVTAIVLTHEHGDHARGAGRMAQEFDCPIYGSAGTLAAVASHSPAIDRCIIGALEPVPIGTLSVTACRTNHDAAEPLAIRVDDREAGTALGLAYDVGRSSNGVRHLLRECNCLVVEANHDELMLRTGPYPPSVRQRIAGSGGHLSNRAAAELLTELMHAGLETVVLAHLSTTCNSPDLAGTTVRRALEDAGFRGQLLVACQAEALRAFDVVGAGGQRALPLVG